MTDEERTDPAPTGEEPIERAPQEVAEKADAHEYPTLGAAGDGTSDGESLARRPDLDEEGVDGDTSKGGTPPGSEIRGS